MLETTKTVNGVKVSRSYREFSWLEKFIVWLHELTKRCTYCHWRSAVWSYMPGWQNACDTCVPRGCSCNQEEDGTEKLDEQGRKWPCCEWHNVQYAKTSPR